MTDNNQKDCRQWCQYSKCGYGDNCIFKHNEAKKGKGFDDPSPHGHGGGRGGFGNRGGRGGFGGRSGSTSRTILPQELVTPDLSI